MKINHSQMITRTQLGAAKNNGERGLKPATTFETTFRSNVVAGFSPRSPLFFSFDSTAAAP